MFCCCKQITALSRNFVNSCPRWLSMAKMMNGLALAVVMTSSCCQGHRLLPFQMLVMPATWTSQRCSTRFSTPSSWNWLPEPANAVPQGSLLLPHGTDCLNQPTLFHKVLYSFLMELTAWTSQRCSTRFSTPSSWNWLPEPANAVPQGSLLLPHGTDCLNQPTLFHKVLYSFLMELTAWTSWPSFQANVYRMTGLCFPFVCMWFSKLVICIKVNLHVKSLFFADHIFPDSLKTIRCVMSLEENIFFRMPRDIFVLFWVNILLFPVSQAWTKRFRKWNWLSEITPWGNFFNCMNKEVSIYGINPLTLLKQNFMWSFLGTWGWFVPIVWLTPLLLINIVMQKIIVASILSKGRVI